MAEIINIEDGYWLKKGHPEGVRTEVMHECMTPVEDCKNPASYGMLCVLCNNCGRFGEEREE